MIRVDVSHVLELATEAASAAAKHEASADRSRKAAQSADLPSRPGMPMASALRHEAEYEQGMAVYWRNAERKARALAARCGERGNRRHVWSRRLASEVAALESDFASMRKLDRRARRTRELYDMNHPEGTAYNPRQ